MLPQASQNPEDVSEVVEKNTRKAIAMQSGKVSRKEIAEKMVEGLMKKFTGEASTGQPFVINQANSLVS